MEIYLILREIWGLCNLMSVSFAYVSCSTNESANILAKHRAYKERFHAWSLEKTITRECLLLLLFKSRKKKEEVGEGKKKELRVGAEALVVLWFGLFRCGNDFPVDTV